MHEAIQKNARDKRSTITVDDVNRLSVLRKTTTFSDSSERVCVIFPRCAQLTPPCPTQPSLISHDIRFANTWHISRRIWLYNIALNYIKLHQRRNVWILCRRQTVHWRLTITWCREWERSAIDLRRRNSIDFLLRSNGHFHSSAPQRLRKFVEGQCDCRRSLWTDCGISRPTPGRDNLPIVPLFKMFSHVNTDF